jgi:hypothetical protein
VLGAGGVQQMRDPIMSANESAALDRSVAALREASEHVLASAS